MRLALAAIAVLAVAAPAGEAQRIPLQKDSYLWTLHFRRDDRLSVRTTLHTKYVAADRTLAADTVQVSTENIAVVSTRGDAEILERVQSSSTTFRSAATQASVSQHPYLSIKLSAQGYAEVSPAEERADPDGMVGLWGLALQAPTPDAAVMIGDSWTNVIPDPIAPGERISIKSSLMKTVRVGNLDLIRVQLSTEARSAGSDAQQVTLEGYYDLDPVAGRVVHSDMKLGGVRMPNMPAGAKLSIEIERDYAALPTP